jgi:hypothetical protein
MPVGDLGGEAVSARGLLAEMLDYAIPHEPSKLVRSQSITETRDNGRDQAIVFVDRRTKRDESEGVPGGDATVQLPEILAVCTSFHLHG